MDCDFRKTVEQINPELLRLEELKILQVNLGNRCNQQCKHCHIGAGPDGQKVMSKSVMADVIDFLRKRQGLTVDITGGCPELNPDFKYFVENVCGEAFQVIVRTNLTVFYEAGLEWVPKWYAKNGITVVASLPCYTEENVNKQRGEGVFKKSISALKMLNELGYGYEGGLELNLVYNPGGDSLPPAQSELEADYKVRLYEDYGVRFNNLFTMTNAPIGRFREYLESSGRLEEYLVLLAAEFNTNAAANIMCRSLISVDYEGRLYNCDFNQVLGLCISGVKAKHATIEQLDELLREGIEVITDEHCFCCTAGAGSSCQGALAESELKV